jgi:hypothetical protein
LGGRGSGRRPYSKRATVQARRSLRIGHLQRLGCFAGRTIERQWNHNGEVVAGITIGYAGPLLNTSYRVRDDSGAWRTMKDRIGVQWKPCNFGGVRPYFVCPGLWTSICGRHVTHLYEAGFQFRCKDCHGLTYASRRASSDQRIPHPLCFVEKVVWVNGSSVIIPKRPQGMWRKTYKRLKPTASVLRTAVQKLLT